MIGLTHTYGGCEHIKFTRGCDFLHFCQKKSWKSLLSITGAPLCHITNWTMW
jgi:lipopolysaccharide biosynthesis glycosyltransferase